MRKGGGFERDGKLVVGSRVVGYDANRVLLRGNNDIRCVAGAQRWILRVAGCAVAIGTRIGCVLRGDEEFFGEFPGLATS